MKYQYIRAFIVLLAGLVTLIINMKTAKSVTASLAILLGVLVVFYFLATLIVEILQKAMEPKEDSGELDEEDEFNSGENNDLEENMKSNAEENVSFDVEDE